MSGIRYLAIEGGDRSGKSTTLKTIVRIVKERTDLKVITYREPHYFKEIITELLEELSMSLLQSLITQELDYEIFTINNKIVEYFMKEREQRLKETIWPAIWSRTDTIIITDRCVLSTWVYQYFLILQVIAKTQGTIIKKNIEEEYLQSVYNQLAKFCDYKCNIPQKILYLCGRPFSKSGDTALLDTNKTLMTLVKKSYEQACVEIQHFQNRIIRFDPRGITSISFNDKELIASIGII